MKQTAAIFLSVVGAVVLVGCGKSEQAAAPEPAVPVRGEAITKLEAEPVPETTPSEAKPVEKQAEALAPTPAEPVQVAEAKPTPAPAEVEKTAMKVAEAVQTAAETKATETAEAVEELIDGEFLSVGFDKLASFEYEVPDEEYDPDKTPDPASQPDQIPTEIKAYNKKRVALKGFMLPLKVEDGNITELLIMRDQSMCCYGTVPKINEWVSVKMTGKGIKPIMDQAVTIYGRLKVGEIRENGYLVGIYEMDGEKMTGPLDL